MGGSNTKDEKSEDQETKDFGIVGDDNDDDTILDQINHTGNPLVDEALNATKTTVREMEKWIANKTNASEEVMGEIVSAIKDIATTGHFGVNGTNATVPVVQDASVGKEEEEDEKLEILRNVPEFRYRSEAALGGGISSGTTTTNSATTMLLQNVNAYERKDYFVFGTISMAFCVAFFCAVVLRKHAQKCTAAAASSSKAKRSGEEDGGKKTIADRGDDDDLEKASLMRSIVGKIKYGSVV